MRGFSRLVLHRKKEKAPHLCEAFPSRLSYLIRRIKLKLINSSDLTFKEFELLKFLAQHPGRVFTRAQLLQEIWGYDYLGGTRTVDVHIRRLRSKLGPEFESIIGTVRNVGYRFTLPSAGKESQISERV